MDPLPVTLADIKTALDDARTEALHVAINTVDLIRSHSETLDEFDDKWALAKDLYRELSAR